MFRDPHHRLVFQNEFVRVVDIGVAPGDTSLFHVHANPMVSVTIRDARTWTQRRGEQGQLQEAYEAPFIGDNWDQQLPLVHRVANVDSMSYRRIAAEWLRSPGVECGAPQAASGFRLVNQGEYGMIYEVRLVPHQSTQRHTHSCPSLIVAGAGSVREGTTGSMLRESQWAWLEAGYSHVLYNGGARTAVVYEVDWR